MKSTQEKEQTLSPESAEQVPAPADPQTEQSVSDESVAASTPKKAKEDDPVKKLVQHYKKSYPECKEFHVTTDNQVFLEAHKNLAILHQNTINPNGKVRTVKA